tara:strand:+ start:1588 stop:1746 length:159 start_codon:yes stop_codon:yes gene_type:complete
MANKNLTPIKAIRKWCLQCSGDSYTEVRLCPIKNCPLYPYRMGKRPKSDTEA